MQQATGVALDADGLRRAELGGAPLHALIAGRKNERDRLIVLEQSPRFGVVGREVTAKFRIEDPAGGTAPVTLSVNGEVTRQAATLAYLQDFRLMMWITLAAIPLIILLRTPAKQAAATAIAKITAKTFLIVFFIMLFF